MSTKNRRGGVIQLQINGVVFDCEGSFSYGLGNPKREAKVGHDRVHGYTELPQAPYIEGSIRDSGDLSMSDLQNLTESTVTLKLANGKTIMLREAWYAAEGKGETEDGKMEVRFEGMGAEEI
jgi:hypothetical protein